MSDITVKTKNQLSFVDPAVCASDKPLTAQIVTDLVDMGNHLYEAVYDSAILPNVTKTVTGHDHSANGNGLFIKRMVFSQEFGVPITNSGATANYKTVDSATFPVHWTTQNASTYIINGGDNYRYTTSPKANEWFLLTEQCFYVSKGATSIQPLLRIGNNAAYNITLRVELCASDGTTIKDYSEETIGTNLNVTYRQIANANGSGAPELWLNSGSIISSAEFYILRVGWKTASTPSANDGPYLFALSCFEK